MLTLEQEAINENTSPERLEELAGIPELAHLVAGNVNTPIDTLIKLSQSDHRENVLKALARNPSVPGEILLDLGVGFPEELAKNPIVNLWLLEDHTPLLTVSPGTLFNLLDIAKNLKTPQDLLSILSLNSSFLIQGALVNNPNTPLEALENLVKNPDLWILNAVGKHPNADSKLRQSITKK